MKGPNVGVGLDEDGARVGPPLITMEVCDSKGPLPCPNDRTRARHVVKLQGAIFVVRRRGGSSSAPSIDHRGRWPPCQVISRAPMGARRDEEPSMRGPRSRHEMPPMGESCAVSGSGMVEELVCLKGDRGGVSAIWWWWWWGGGGASIWPD